MHIKGNGYLLDILDTAGQGKRKNLNPFFFFAQNLILITEKKF